MKLRVSHSDPSPPLTPQSMNNETIHSYKVTATK